jgi:predicted nucleic acid binding AN1-type Zn finger protein
MERRGGRIMQKLTQEELQERFKKTFERTVKCHVCAEFQTTLRKCRKCQKYVCEKHWNFARRQCKGGC